MFEWEWVQAVRERRGIEAVLHEACNLGFQLVWFRPAVMTLKKAGTSSGSIGMRRK